jgi:hypothetical protein
MLSNPQLHHNLFEQLSGLLLENRWTALYTVQPTALKPDSLLENIPFPNSTTTAKYLDGPLL